VRRALLAVAVALLIVVPSCSSAADDTNTDRLTGVTWVLDASSMDSLVVDASPTDARIDLTLGAEEAFGTSACNSYRGSYALDGDRLTFGPFAATQMACEQPLMDLEAAYLAELGEVSGFEVEADGTLVLTGGDVALSFTAEVPLALIGTTWRVTTIASANAVSSTIADTELTAGFGDDGTVTGTDGCNRYRAEYSASGGSITIGAPAGTFMACEPDVEQQARAFTGAMQAAAAYEISGTSLTLSDDAGNLLLVFDGSA